MGDLVSEMKWHEASMIFPMMGDSELASLSDDIEKNGQRDPCLIVGGKIIDGRNRWMACKMRGIEPKTKQISEPDDPVAFVLSLNLHRRHLTPSQSSMCAARAREIYERDAKERRDATLKQNATEVENLPQRDVGKARDIAGKAFGVSGKSVDHAKRVIEKGIPELSKAVDQGRMAVSTAAILATEPEDIQRAEVNNPQRNRTYSASRGGGKVSDKKTNNDPIHNHMDSKDFAISKAEVAITQLKGIPQKNKFREEAFQLVSNWISKKG